MPPTFQPRTPTRAPLDLQAEIDAILSGQLDVSEASEEAVMAVASQSVSQPSGQVAGNPESAVSARIEAELAAQNQSEAEQQEFENVLAMLEIIQSEQGQQPQVIDDRAPPLGGTVADFGGGSELEASTANSRMMQSLNYDSIMRQRDQASLDRNPVQMSQPMAGPPLEESMTRARTLLDLLTGRGGTGTGPLSSPANAANMGGDQGGMPVPSGAVYGPAGNMTQAAAPMSPPMASGVGDNANILEFLKRLTNPRLPSIR